MPGQTALDVNIGTAVGAGSLGISGGDLLAGRDVFVGRDGGGVNVGSLDVSGGTLDAGDDITVGAGSAGTMTQSSAGAVIAGDDFFVNAGSSLTVTGGTLNVGDRLITDDDAIVSVDGGDVIADDDFFFFGSAQITVDSGLMEVKDKLRFDDVLTTGKLTINGGLVRSQEFGFVDGSGAYIMNGTLEINGTGAYQSEQPRSREPHQPVERSSGVGTYLRWYYHHKRGSSARTYRPNGRCSRLFWVSRPLLHTDLDRSNSRTIFCGVVKPGRTCSAHAA